MSSRVEYRLLGPVEVWVDGRRLDAGPPRRRAVLAALLVDAGRVVPVETLIARVWGQEVPEHARATLQTHLSRIRRLLEEAATRGDSAPALSSASGGYLLRVDADQIDLYQFRRSAGRPGDSESLRAALELWRGEPLAGIEGDWAGRMREIWNRERIDTAVTWARAELAQANPRPVLATLGELASENPLAESLTEVLMRALHATGRTAEALDLYARTRAHLAEELGTDPTPGLQQLHESLLRGEIATAAATAPATALAARPAWPVPRQLPAPPQLFTGRMMELAELEKIHDARTVVITAIDGMAGVGKTALAVHAAHEMVDRYPDGQLFIDLHGYTEGVSPVEPAEALDFMLRSLGVAGEGLPTNLDQRSALYRSRLAEQRMVIVLDNAATEAQVRPLLPGAPGCLVLVTSRRRLAGLDHTHVLSLDTLPPADAIALLRQTAGESWLAGEPPDLVAELVELCGRLPLAIRIAAARLRSHPAWDLAHLVRRLHGQQHRLVELEAGERSVVGALDLSYQDLGAGPRRSYRLLGLHPGSDIDPSAAVALLDTTLSELGRAVEHLLEAHLLQEPSPGRYRFHDLTRAHAGQTAVRDETEESRSAALDRLLDYYRHAAAMAMDTAYPYDRDHRPPVPPAPTPSVVVADPAAALGWLDSELPNLLACARYAAERGRASHLLHLSSILQQHLRNRGLYDDAETLHRQALRTARDTGQQTAELDALTGLGHVHRLQGRYDQAIDLLAQALRLARTSGYQPAELDALVGLGIVHRMQSRYELATVLLGQALGIARTTGHRVAELQALIGFGDVHRMQGRYQLATDRYQQARRLTQATDHQAGELQALSGLAHVYRARGQYEQSTDHYQEVLRLARAIGHPTGELNALNGLGHLHRLQGRYEQAADHYQQALRIARGFGHPTGELNALTGLGRVHRLQGWYELAIDSYQQALLLARATGHPTHEQAAMTGLGDVDRLQGRYEQAIDHYQGLLALARGRGNRNYQFEARHGLGRLYHATGDPAAALIEYDHALGLAIALDQPDDQARAHDGMAHAQHALGQSEQAGIHWRQALEILARLGVDHTDDQETTVAVIRQHLSDDECGWPVRHRP